MVPKPESQWFQAYFRMVRRYSRFRSINAGVPHQLAKDFLTRDYAADGTLLGLTLSDPGAFFHDDVVAFFQACYHLKDWIKNDPAAAPVAPLVEGYISRTPCLALAADICNGSKHLVLTMPPRSGHPSDFLHIGTTQNVRLETIAMSFRVDTPTGSQDAFQVATDCVKAWNAFVRANLLSTLVSPWKERVVGHAHLWGL
jgi:hypothetical protein